jgi:lysophospholipase L1-like esterase
MKSQLKRCFALILAVGALLSVGTQSAWAQIKVACVGDSITAGYALTNPWADSYPSQLATILGSGYNVGNFGLSGATVQKRSDYTYWNTSQYRNSLRFKPNVVVIMLGTNDSKPWNWNSAKFNADYKALIAQYQGLQTRPTVYICLIPPVYTPNPFGTAFDPVFVQNVVVPAIRTVATEAGVTLIDNNTPLMNAAYFSDGVHPTPEGAGIIADTVALTLP